MNAVQESLSTDINVITAEINAYQRVAGEAIFAIGERLLHVKENDLVHGEWEKWLKEVSMTKVHANRFMRVYERFGKVTPVLRLPSAVSVLYALTEFDDEELEKPREMPDGSTKKLTEMSRREIEEFKKRETEILKEKEKALTAAEEARRRADMAEARAKRAEEDYGVMRDTVESMREQPPTVEYKTEYVRDERIEERLRNNG